MSTLCMNAHCCLFFCLYWQFRHGATMHGPKPRDYSYTLPKKVRRLGLKIALSARVAEGKVRHSNFTSDVSISVTYLYIV